MIISYDGTPNDDDALALGRLLAKTGAKAALAYVRHSREFDPGREQIAQHDAERRLEAGALQLGEPDIARHVVLSASTGEGLIRLAESEGASVIVFGSDYRTPPGHAEPGTTAQHLLEGGPVAVAVAAAGLRAGAVEQITSVAALPGEDPGVEQAASELAEKLGASVVAADGGHVDLIVVGSQPSSSGPRTGLSGITRSTLNVAQGSVLVLPYGRGLSL